MSEEKKAVLMVDDEPEILRLFVAVLGDHFAIETAGSVAEAKEIMKPRRFDLVITDMVMPGASGVDLVAYIQRVYPTVAVLVMTGIEDSLTKLGDLGTFEVISKPFSFKKLRETIDKVLGLT